MSEELGTTGEETQDVIDYGRALMEALTVHKRDDGVIDTAEITSTLITTSPEALAALVGAGKMKDEIKRMTADQRQEKLVAAAEVLQGFVKLFFSNEKAPDGDQA